MTLTITHNQISLRARPLPLSAIRRSMPSPHLSPGGVLPPATHGSSQRATNWSDSGSAAVLST